MRAASGMKKFTTKLFKCFSSRESHPWPLLFCVFHKSFISFRIFLGAQQVQLLAMIGKQRCPAVVLGLFQTKLISEAYFAA
jgi:hypothetical protein